MFVDTDTILSVLNIYHVMLWVGKHTISNYSQFFAWCVYYSLRRRHLYEYAPCSGLRGVGVSGLGSAAAGNVVYNAKLKQ